MTLSYLREKNSPLYGTVCGEAARRKRLAAARKRRVASLRRRTGAGYPSVVMHSIPFSLRLDIREVGRAARDLGVCLPVDIRVIPLEEQEKSPNRNGYWTMAEGRHQVFLSVGLLAAEANRVLLHELGHCFQWEREAGKGRNWNQVAAAARNVARDSYWDSWIEREAFAIADEFGGDYSFFHEQ
jgi:hypothetical protein